MTERCTAATIAATITPQSAVNDADTNGWRFQSLQDINVTELGAWDLDSDGFSTAVDVGLWNDSGVLLGSVVLPSGASGTLDSGFRFASITAVGLTAGDFYVVGSSAQSGTLPYQNLATGLVTASEISFSESRFAGSANTLTFPTNNGDGNNGPTNFGYFGANFRFEPIPEPSTFSLATLGLLSLGMIGRRRRSR